MRTKVVLSMTSIDGPWSHIYRLVELDRVPCIGESVVIADGWAAITVTNVLHDPDEPTEIRLQSIPFEEWSRLTGFGWSDTYSEAIG